MSAAATELRRRQEHTQFLMRELAHRAKNQLAVVRGMAQQTARQSVSVEQFVTQFSQRIQGLAESQDLMLRQNWQGAWLADLVRAHLDLFGAVSRAHIKGPELFLSADAVQNIGFALHELATNASKHGAISAPGGSIGVTWYGPDADGRVHHRLEGAWRACGRVALAPRFWVSGCHQAGRAGAGRQCAARFRA